MQDGECIMRRKDTDEKKKNSKPPNVWRKSEREKKQVGKEKYGNRTMC